MPSGRRTALLVVFLALAGCDPARPRRENPSTAEPAPPSEIDCIWTVGTLFAANGTPSLRIRVRETRRVLGVTSDAGSEAPGVLPANARTAIESCGDVFATEVTGEWLVCPREPERPGTMRSVGVIEARNLSVAAR